MYDEDWREPGEGCSVTWGPDKRSDDDSIAGKGTLNISNRINSKQVSEQLYCCTCDRCEMRY